MGQPAMSDFFFRNLQPNVFMGTASDRYAGWIGQIYSKERYSGRISMRSKRVGGRTFVEEVLPVESVEEYFEHFGVLELDFTFYGTLKDEEGKPNQSFHVLHSYSKHLSQGDRLILKVPQTIFAKKIRIGEKFVENRGYLSPDIFVDRFYMPAVEILDPWLTGFIFEQEYQRKDERDSPDKLAGELDSFFNKIPVDDRYHIELRTESFLSKPVFKVFEKHGIGQVLSHWTWLPSLLQQFSKGERRFLNKDKQCIVRLMTPRGVRYEEAYGKAYPFNTLVDGMTNQNMVEETVNIMQAAVKEGAKISVLVNNRAGGNAPAIAQMIMKQFLLSWKN